MKTSVITLLALVLIVAHGLAQTPNESFNNSRSLREPLSDPRYTDDEVQSLYPGENEDLGPQYLVKTKPRKRYFQARADSQFFYTSNMFLQEEPRGDEGTETMVWVNTAEFALAPDPYDLGPGTLAPRLGYRHQWYNYGLDDDSNGLNNFDFDVQTVFADMRYNLDEKWFFKAGVEWNRLLGHESTSDDYDEFYKEFLPHWGVERRFKISDHQLFAVSYDSRYHITEVDSSITVFPGLVLQQDDDINDRMDHMLTVAYAHVFADQLVLQPYYRLQYTDYTVDGDRNDILHTLGMSATWHFSQWGNLRYFVNWDKRDSDDPTIADYEKIDTGLGLNATIRF